MKTLNEQNLKLQLNVRFIFSKLLLRKVAENKQKSKMFHVNFQTDLLVHGSGSAWRPSDEDLVPIVDRDNFIYRYISVLFIMIDSDLKIV